MKKVAAIALLFLVGCQANTGHSLSEEERQEVIERARIFLLESGTLTSVQVAGVKTKSPSLAYDFPGTLGARYFIHFELSPFDVITIEGEGDIRILEHAHIRERPHIPAKQTEPNKPVQNNSVDAPRKSRGVTAISRLPRSV